MTTDPGCEPNHHTALQAIRPSALREIQSSCLCFSVQRAARVVGRRFDDAFRPLGINNWQFSLMMAVGRPDVPTVGQIADWLGMDRTTTSTNLRPLERRGLIEVRRDPDDGRARRVMLTPAGTELLAAAAERWREVNTAVANGLDPAQQAGLRQALAKIAVQSDEDVGS